MKSSMGILPMCPTGVPPVEKAANAELRAADPKRR
jgi:hypothetical protein